MTDKLIEQIKASRSGEGVGPWTRSMEARILADAEVIKAAEELAEVLDNVTGKTWAATVDMEDACKVDAALAAFRQAQARAEKGGK